jgi:hypothetical protein
LASMAQVLLQTSDELDQTYDFFGSRTQRDWQKTTSKPHRRQKRIPRNRKSVQERKT